MNEAVVEAVLALVERIPPGRVMSYGAIAECVGQGPPRLRCSARQVGRIMALYGDAVPWHRVVAANGRLPTGHVDRARQLLVNEGVEVCGERVRMASSAWYPAT